MKRILFVSIANLYLCPYINKYISAIGDSAEYDIVYWNRHGVEDGDYGAKNVYVYRKDSKDFISRAVKLIRQMEYCRFVAKLLRTKKYDGVILLHTNAAILLSGILLTKYKHRYIYDIRDYSFENNPVFYQLEKLLIHNSAQCFISSDGFRKFLPEYDYHLVHNNAPIDPEFIQQFRQTHQGHLPARISFVGMVRFFEQGKALARCLGNDPRFCINYFGKNADLMHRHIGEYDNHAYVDQFSPEKTLDCYEETDIINNVYGNNNPSVDYLCSNKLYYCTMLGLPILVSPDTFMEEITRKYEIGFVFDEKDPQIADKLYAYYTNIDWQKFYEKCDAFCRMVEEDDREFVKVVRDFVA